MRNFIIVAFAVFIYIELKKKFNIVNTNVSEKMTNFFSSFMTQEKFVPLRISDNIPARSKNVLIPKEAGEALVDHLVKISPKSLGEHQRDFILIKVFGKELRSTKIQNISNVVALPTSSVDSAFRRFGL